MRPFVPFSASGRLTTLKSLVRARSCRPVYKPQVGSRSLLISWEPAEWDSTHRPHPLNVSDWTCLVSRLQRNQKNKQTNSPQQPGCSVYQMCYNDLRLGLLQMHMRITNSSCCQMTVRFFALQWFCEIQTWLVVGNVAVLTTHSFSLLRFSERHCGSTALGTCSWSHHNEWPAMLCFASFLHRHPVKYLPSTKKRRKQWLGDNEYKILATHLKPRITQVFKSGVRIPYETNSLTEMKHRHTTIQQQK